MGVILQGKPVVAHRVFTVFCLGHSPENQLIDDRLRAHPFRLLQQLCQDGGRHPVLEHRGAEAQALQRLPQRGDPLRIRVLMDAVDKGKLQPPGQLCRRLVCQQHEFLNDQLRLPALPRLYIQNPTVFVKNQLTFR